MSASSGDDLATLVTDLVRTLHDLETEIEPSNDRGPFARPTARELMRFTSDVTIPAAILVLRTNIEVLKLLRRAIRLAEGRPTESETGSGAVRSRAARLSEQTLTRLDDALLEIQRAVEGRPEDEEARDLLREARRLRTELAEQLQAAGSSPSDRDSTADATQTDVAIDVDAELESIKDDLEDSTDGDDDPPDSAGTDED